jgi:DNA replication protein
MDTSIDPDEGVTLSNTYYEEYVVTATSLDELQVILAISRASAKGDENAGVSEEVLLRDVLLAQAMGVDGADAPPPSRVLRALEMATRRGALQRRARSAGDRQIVLYSLSDRTHSGTGEQPVSRQGPESKPGDGAPSVFAAYERNIGVLTPLVADQISAALELYPTDWLHDAIEEAVAYNRRQWRYVHRILQNWTAEGRPAASGSGSEGTYAKNQRGTSGALNTDQYRSGRHLDRARKA